MFRAIHVQVDVRDCKLAAAAYGKHTTAAQAPTDYAEWVTRVHISTWRAGTRLMQPLAPGPRGLATTDNLLHGPVKTTAEASMPAGAYTHCQCRLLQNNTHQAVHRSAAHLSEPTHCKTKHRS